MPKYQVHLFQTVLEEAFVVVEAETAEAAIHALRESGPGGISEFDPDWQFVETTGEVDVHCAVPVPVERSACDVCGSEDRPTATMVAFGTDTNVCDRCRDGLP